MFGFGKKKTYKVKWLEPKNGKWFVRYTTTDEGKAFETANQLEAQGHRIRIYVDEEKNAVYTSKSARPLF
jgi:hypothetical protein